MYEKTLPHVYRNFMTAFAATSILSLSEGRDLTDQERKRSCYEERSRKGVGKVWIVRGGPDDCSERSHEGAESSVQIDGEYSVRFHRVG
jgi:hypothetical protein